MALVHRTKAVRVDSDTRAAIVQEDHTGLCGGISNMFLCRGEPGKVLRIEVQCIIVSRGRLILWFRFLSGQGLR